MEQLNSDYLDSQDVLRAEHYHRYMWAAGYACGDVCDIASGPGYGAEILMNTGTTKSYVGIDTSPTAIDEATKRFASENVRYMVASATSIPLADASIDTIVSLETLEHLERPSLALAEFKRILRPEGTIVGSVPSSSFDELADHVYGKNPFHVTRFSHADLTQLLEGYFSVVRVYYSALGVFTQIGRLVDGCPTRIEQTTTIREVGEEEVFGSFHFVASNRPWANVDAAHQSKMYYCTSLVNFEALKMVPLRRLIEQNEQLIRLKDERILQAEELVRVRDAQLRETEELVRLRDTQLRQAEELVHERDAQIASMNRLLAKDR